MMQKIALILSLLCGAAIILLSGPFMALLNIPVLLAVLWLVTFITACIHGPQNLWDAAREVLHASGNRDRQKTALEVVRTIDQGALWTSTLCMISGILLLFATMDTPSTIGPNVSLALHGSMYGLIVSRLICYPLGCSLRRHLGKGPSSLGDDLVFNLFQLIFPVTNYLCFLVVVFALLNKGGPK